MAGLESDIFLQCPLRTDGPISGYSIETDESIVDSIVAELNRAAEERPIVVIQVHFVTGGAECYIFYHPDGRVTLGPDRSFCAMSIES